MKYIYVVPGFNTFHSTILNLDIIVGSWELGHRQSKNSIKKVVSISEMSYANKLQISLKLIHYRPLDSFCHNVVKKTDKTTFPWA